MHKMNNVHQRAGGMIPLHEHKTAIMALKDWNESDTFRLIRKERVERRPVDCEKAVCGSYD